MPQPVRSVLLAGLLVLSIVAAAAAQDTPAKPTSTVDAPTILVTSVVPGFVAKDGNTMGAVVQFDLLNADLQKALAGQSTRLVIDIDCTGEKIRARNMIVYKEPKQGGAAAEVRIKDDWESYHGGAYLADVARSICHQDGGKALSTAAKPAALAPPPAKPLISNSPMPSAVVAATSRSRFGDGPSVQFISSSSEAEAKAAISKIRARLGAEIGQKEFSIQPAFVKGITHYRGRLGQFDSPIDAKNFCTKIIEMNFKCFPVNNNN
jgi:hypothetical protein